MKIMIQCDECKKWIKANSLKNALKALNAHYTHSHNNNARYDFALVTKSNAHYLTVDFDIKLHNN